MPKEMFFTPDVVYDRLVTFWKSKDFDRATIIDLCAYCVVDMIKDAEFMIEFEGIGVEKIRGMVKLPCNIFRIMDVYDDDEINLRASNNGSYLYNIQDDNGNEPDNGDIIYLNYRGIPVNEKGIPLMAPWHTEACETFCKIKYFEEDYATGQMRPDTYIGWQNDFSGMLVSARYNNRLKTRKKIDDLNIVRYNMITQINDLPIKQRMYGSGQ